MVPRLGVWQARGSSVSTEFKSLQKRKSSTTMRKVSTVELRALENGLHGKVYVFFTTI